MSFRVTLKLGPVDDMIDKLKTVRTPLKRAMKDIGADMKTLVKTQFATSQDPHGEAWAPLSPNTIRRRKFPGRPILIQTRKLSRRIIKRVRAYSATLSLTAPYAHRHNDGTTIMPRRMLVPKADRMPPRWTKMFIENFNTELRKHFNG